MQYVISGGKFVLSGGKFLGYTPQLIFKLSVIRNAEMNNVVGDAGSTNLTITDINLTTGVLTVPNIPVYDGFAIETGTWAIKDISNNTNSILCTIDSTAKTVTLNPSTGTSVFTVGHNISLFNPFLNYDFSGDQLSVPSLPYDGGVPWRNVTTGPGPIFKDPDTGVYKWLFLGQRNDPTVANQVGLAVSNDLQTWDVSNGDNPIMSLEMTGTTSCYLTGSVMKVDSSYCAVMNNNIGGVTSVRLVYFDKDVSNLSFSPILQTNAGYGCIEKVGSDYLMLFTDISTNLAHRNVQAAKSTTGIEGPYINYQTVIYAEAAIPGTIWDTATDGTSIINDGKKIMGMFGAQGTVNIGLSGGVGATNREMVLLDFDSSTQLWSINPLGPVIINPIDWPTDYYWGSDHCGAGVYPFLDGSTMYMSLAMSQGGAYNATVIKLKNFN